MKKAILIIVGIVFLLILSLIIPKNTSPPNDTRIILEHTNHTYIAPPCFEQSGATNFIEDSNLEEAEKLEYISHDNCTEAALEEERDSLGKSLLKNLGLIATKWDEW